MISEPSPPPTNLANLPSELIALIAEKVDIASRCTIRKCSKDLYDLMDESTFVVKDLNVSLVSVGAIVRFGEGLQLLYQKQSEECYIQGCSSKRIFNSKVVKDNYLETVVNDLMTNLKNPKLIVKHLTFKNYDQANFDIIHPFLALLHQKLNELGHNLHVESATFHHFNEDDVMQIVPFFQPEILKKLNMELKKHDPLTQIINLDQWKQAEHLCSNVIEPLDEILHFKKVEFRCCSLETKSIPWDQFKSFLEKVIGQADHSLLQLKAPGLKVPEELEDYIKNKERINATEYFSGEIVLRNLEDGVQLVMVQWPCLGILKFVNGQKDDSFQ